MLQDYWEEQFLSQKTDENDSTDHSSIPSLAVPKLQHVPSIIFCAGVLVLKGVLAYPVEEVCLCGSAYQVIR